MPIRLECFPVLVPPGFDFAQALSVPRPRGGGECPVHVTFTDDFRAPRRNGRPHDAIDIFGAIGLWVVAATDGQVVATWRYDGRTLPGAGYSNGGGNFVRMLDRRGNMHYYAHLRSAATVRSGDPVHAGQRLGYLGRTGLATSTCPHLHYQVRGPSPWNPGRGSVAINPHSELRRTFPITAAA